MRTPTREFIEAMRQMYPKGSRITLNHMEDPYHPIEPGMTGTLDYIDDMATFHVTWDNGRTLGVVYGVDSFNIEAPKPTTLKLYMPLTAHRYANSTESCHVLGDVHNDEQLGRFYAENDFIPELEDVPDFAFERLDFAKIGKEMREGERGIFTHYGYVLQSGELLPDLADHKAPPKTPEYTLRLLIARYPFETGGDPEVTTTLDLPTDMNELVTAMERVGAASWEEVIFTVEDSAIPGFPEDLYGNSFEELNDYAQAVKEIQDSGELTKLKAILSTKFCSNVQEAMELAEQLDHFYLEQRLHDPVEIAE